MNRFFKAFICAAVFVLSSAAGFAEVITMRTWYPSPYGSYSRLSAKEFIRFGAPETVPENVPAGTVYYSSATECLMIYTGAIWKSMCDASRDSFGTLKWDVDTDSQKVPGRFDTIGKSYAYYGGWTWLTTTLTTSKPENKVWMYQYGSNLNVYPKIIKIETSDYGKSTYQTIYGGKFLMRTYYYTEYQAIMRLVGYWSNSLTGLPYGAELQRSVSFYDKYARKTESGPQAPPDTSESAGEDGGDESDASGSYDRRKCYGLRTFNASTWYYTKRMGTNPSYKFNEYTQMSFYTLVSTSPARYHYFTSYLAADQMTWCLKYHGGGVKPAPYATAMNTDYTGQACPAAATYTDTSKTYDYPSTLYEYKQLIGSEPDYSVYGNFTLYGYYKQRNIFNDDEECYEMVEFGPYTVNWDLGQVKTISLVPQLYRASSYIQIIPKEMTLTVYPQ